MKLGFALISALSALSCADAFAFTPSVALGTRVSTSNTILFAEEEAAAAEEPVDEPAEAPAAVPSSDDILNSPAFLKRKVDVMKSDIEAAEEKIAAANAVYEENKAEYGDQIENLRKEYANIQDRLDKQSGAADVTTVREVSNKLLSVLDNYNRAFGVIEAESDEEKEIEASYKNVHSMVLDTLAGLGLKEVKTVGTEFDYEFHSAVMMRPDEDYEEGMVCEELAKGYAMEDGTLVRAAMVVVAA